MFLNVYKYGCSLCDDSFSFMFTYLYLSLTLCAPTMRHLRLALNRRGWSMHSTVRGGPSFWPCAGLTHTHTCYRRSLLPSHSLRWPKANFQMIINDSKWIPWLYAFGLSAVPTLCLCRSCMGAYRMILGYWELWKTWFLTWRKSSNYSMFPSFCMLNFHCDVSRTSPIHCFFFSSTFCSSEEAKATKKVSLNH